MCSTNMPFGKSQHGWIPCIAVSIMKTPVVEFSENIAINNKVVLHSFRNSADHDDGLWDQPKTYLQQFSSTVPNTFYAGYTVPPGHFQFVPLVFPPPCRDSGRESPASCVSSDEPLSGLASGKRWESTKVKVLLIALKENYERLTFVQLANNKFHCTEKT